MKKILAIIICTLLTLTSLAQLDKKIAYYDNGNKKELLHYYGKQLNGTCMAWNENGVLIGKVQYLNGNKNGKWFMWHNNGNIAYRFYYDNNQKVGVWKYYDSTGVLLGQKEYAPKYHGQTLITLGTFTLSDISIGLTHRINKNSPITIGAEYSTYFSDGEREFDEFTKFGKHSILATTGLVSNNAAILLKAGSYFGTEEDEYLNNINYVKFDYGIEALLFFEDETTKIQPLFGFGISKSMGIQFKFGIII